jgi:hypothetical protein
VKDQKPLELNYYVPRADDEDPEKLTVAGFMTQAMLLLMCIVMWGTLFLLFAAG